MAFAFEEPGALIVISSMAKERTCVGHEEGQDMADRERLQKLIDELPDELTREVVRFLEVLLDDAKEHPLDSRPIDHELAAAGDPENLQRIRQTIQRAERISRRLDALEHEPDKPGSLYHALNEAIDWGQVKIDLQQAEGLFEHIRCEIGRWVKKHGDERLIPTALAMLIAYSVALPESETPRVLAIPMRHFAWHRTQRIVEMLFEGFDEQKGWGRAPEAPKAFENLRKAASEALDAMRDLPEVPHKDREH